MLPDESSLDPVLEDPGLRAKTSLAYAKLVATPTDSSWSQVYNAGNLFACLSLSLKGPPSEEDEDEPVSLHATGKELLNILESEFFTLEEKNIKTIKEAIKTSVEHAPPTVQVNLSLALFKDEILYVFIAGGGKILMKRGEQTGTLLKQSADERSVVAASGFLHNKDTVILETEQFAQDISEKTLLSALELALPSDIAEALSPQIHEKDDGGQAAIIIAYHGITRDIDEETKTLAEATAVEEELNDLYSPKEEPMPKLKEPLNLHLPKLPHVKFPKLKMPHLPHKKRLFLSISIILLALLIASIFLFRNNQERSKQRQLFTSIYNSAQKNYEEGVALQSLNKNLSRDDFLKAEKVLKENLNKFKKGSEEERQIADLLAKIEAELKATGNSVANIITKEAADDASSLLKAEKDNSDGKSFGEDSKGVYFITNKAILSADGKKELIKNDGDWEKPQALVPYQGNFYVLDQKKGVLKYTAGSDGFGKSSYFKKAPDLSSATSMAIDGSVWIIFSDGTISKFIRGESDGFKVNGLSSPFANPTKIFTNTQTGFLYILDRGNSRVVKLSKDGSFEKQYASSIIGEASDLDVSEDDKKIYILAKDKVWEIPL